MIDPDAVLDCVSLSLSCQPELVEGLSLSCQPEPVEGHL